MTRQQSTRRRGLKILLMGLELLIFLANAILAYTSKHKMGMQRHMVYLNSKLEAKLPLGLIKIALIGILLIFSLLVLRNILRGERSFGAIWTEVLLVGSLVYIVFYSKDLNRSYYYISLLLFLSTLVQLIIYRLERRV